MDLYTSEEMTHTRTVAITEDAVEEMIALAERLRAQNGGVLDEAAIQAVAEATSAPVELVRITARIRAEQGRANPLATLRAQFLSLDANTRRFVTAGLLATLAALLWAIEWRVGDAFGRYGILTMAAILVVFAGFGNLLLSKDARAAAINGTILGGGTFAMFSLFSLILQTPVYIASFALIPIALGSAVGGVLAYKLLERFRPQLGLKDPKQERQELLSQLVQLQNRLRQGEQRVSFLSVDIVGSTKMKEAADPLSVEYTFSEYHHFVERITQRNGGRVHSTAGDGVTCAFEDATNAFNAARAIQRSLVELNTYRNQIGRPIVVRCGVHSGTVVTPDGLDIKSVNFSQVIDVAAHAQKACPAGGIAVTDASIGQIPNGPREVGDERLCVDELSLTIWRPRPAPSLQPAGAKPPPTPVSA